MFDLPGPTFLLAYLGVALAVLAGLYVSRRLFERASAGTLRATDPYLIAYLHSGAKRAIQAACVALVGRGLVRVASPAAARTGVLLERSRADAHDIVKHPLERALVRALSEDKHAADLLADASIADQLAPLRDQLSAHGYLPTDFTRVQRAIRFLAGLTVLWGVAGKKLALAAERGHSNVLFLVVLAVLASLAAWRITYRHRTAGGDGLLRHLAELFSAAKQRVAEVASPDRGLHLALVAGLYGLESIPLTALPQRDALKLDARQGSPGFFGETVNSSGGGDSLGGDSDGGGDSGGCGGCGD